MIRYTYKNGVRPTTGTSSQDIVGTGFEYEGTERNRLAKQGWKEAISEAYLTSAMVREGNEPVVIDYDVTDNNDNVKGKEDKDAFFDERARFENVL